MTALIKLTSALNMVTYWIMKLIYSFDKSKYFYAETYKLAVT